MNTKFQIGKPVNGRVLYVDSNCVWIENGRRLFVSHDNGETWRHLGGRCRNVLCEVRDSVFRTRLMARLLRGGYHHVVPYNASGVCGAVAFRDRDIYWVDLESGSHKHISHVIGSRPLNVTMAGGKIYYGEYRRNKERTQVSVWASSEFPFQRWERVWTFDNVRHVHGVFYDQFEGAFWVTTGDNDDEAGIWKSDDNFKSLNRIIGGTQQTRVVQLLFTRNFIYFGSDAPMESNAIYRMRRGVYEPESLQVVGGPIYSGASVGDAMFFSTVVEPQGTSGGDTVEVWGSENGVEWVKLYCAQKDCWHGLLFQYGQISFSRMGVGAKTVWCNHLAVDGDGTATPISVIDVHS